MSDPGFIAAALGAIFLGSLLLAPPGTATMSRPRWEVVAPVETSLLPAISRSSR